METRDDLPVETQLEDESVRRLDTMEVARPELSRHNLNKASPHQTSDRFHKKYRTHFNLRFSNRIMKTIPDHDRFYIVRRLGTHIKGQLPESWVRSEGIYEREGVGVTDSCSADPKCAVRRQTNVVRKSWQVRREDLGLAHQRASHIVSGG